MTLSAWDDYPVHQSSEPIRHVATSDRNFYDRYYFNCFPITGELFLVMGLGQYPNLGTQDAFAVVRRGDQHHVVRASRTIGDRSDLDVGPFHLEVLEPLQSLRFRLEEGQGEIAFDLTWTGTHPAHEEPRQFIRKHGRVLFDTARFCQNGRWSGTLTVAGERFEVDDTTWWGMRDRSWGVRPVGEAEPPGIRGEGGQMAGLWNYAPMQFDDHSIHYIVQEEPDGHRALEEAVLVPHDGSAETNLGRPEWSHTLAPGTRRTEGVSVLSFPEAPDGPLEIRVNPLLRAYVAIGTGYGVEEDWRHGMYQGELVVQGLTRQMDELEGWAWYSLTEVLSRFETSTGDVGYGMHEIGLFGPFPPLGLHERHDTAPGGEDPAPDGEDPAPDA